MCGRYSLAIRPREIRQRLVNAGLPVDEVPQNDDDAVRQSYNVAPGNIEPVYRADVPRAGEGSRSGTRTGTEIGSGSNENAKGSEGIKYIIQPMKWGLVPSWTKRKPDYAGLMKTINCRDDSLIENRGLWNSVKHKKRCVVLAEGFFEWQKKSGQRIPHFVKRKDGQLLYMAGLWDCCQYEGSDEKLYTYTVITTSSNPQLNFLHDRMPVILEDAAAVSAWLSPETTTWSSDLLSLLKPYAGELDFYPVSKDVGNVKNNSPTFVVPLDSKENKGNIKNFFGNAAAKKKTEDIEQGESKEEKKAEKEMKGVEKDETENNAPLPLPKQEEGTSAGRKRTAEEDTSPRKEAKIESSTKRTRSATSNTNRKTIPSPKKGTAKSDGNTKITNFFTK